MVSDYTPPLDTDETYYANGWPAAFDHGRVYGRRQLMHEQAQKPTARRTDPATSHAAAASVDQLREKARGVLTVLWHYGPATDQQLEGRYALMRQYDEVPAQSPSGLRTRRAELVRLGMVHDTGERRQISTGRNAIVWAATVPEPAPVVG